MYLQNPLRYVLHRVFWSFPQTEHAFRYCQPVVLVDGTFLTEKYRGTLMMAAAVDPEDQIVLMVMVHAASMYTSAWPISHYMFDLGPTRRDSSCCR
jgi:hypothetical protein